tara:strand:- start:133 stop:402 length:270 start_codon:yes stop_codon:yes gene_type:complete
MSFGSFVIILPVFELQKKKKVYIFDCCPIKWPYNNLYLKVEFFIKNYLSPHFIGDPKIYINTINIIYCFGSVTVQENGKYKKTTLLKSI